MPEENLESIVSDVAPVEETKELKNIRRTFRSWKSSEPKRNLAIVGGVLVAAVLVFLGASLLTGRGGSLLSPLGDRAGGLLGGVQNPLTGEMVSGKSAEAWKDVRPLAVMVNNHTDARPQSGLIYADLVYEIVAEGGITRLLPFYLSNIPEKIGPVRSTREYYLVLVKELGDAMLMHIGWSPQALEAIETWPVRSLGRGGGQFWRDTSLNVATEHTAYVNGKDLLQLAMDLGWGGTREFRLWEFKNDKTGYDSAPAATHVSIDFWSKGDYSAVFKYDAGSNSYLRYLGYDASDQPISHIDRETKEQIKVKNLVVQFVPENAIAGDDKNRLNYEFVGTGSALVFLDGKVINVTWTKDSRDDRTIFYDGNGQEIKFNRGKIWVSVVPDRNVDQVVYN